MKENVYMIPKKIHYCWFGGNPKPEIIEKCIASWRKFCPDYEIIEWNESNYDINKSVFMKEAYECKKWGFVPDYARFDIVSEHGGFYLDTDVELLDSLDSLLEYDAIFAFETARNIACGLGFGSVKNHKSVNQCLETYKNKHFVIDGKMDQTPSPRINTNSLIQCYPTFQRTGQTQIIDGCIFLSMSDYDKLMLHHGTATWVDCKVDGKGHKPSKFNDFIRDPKKFVFLEKHFGQKAVDIYEFLTYDLRDYGLMYYIKRKFLKIKSKKQ